MMTWSPHYYAPLQGLNVWKPHVSLFRWKFFFTFWLSVKKKKVLITNTDNSVLISFIVSLFSTLTDIHFLFTIFFLNKMIYLFVLYCCLLLVAFYNILVRLYLKGSSVKSYNTCISTELHLQKNVWDYKVLQWWQPWLEQTKVNWLPL